MNLPAYRQLLGYQFSCLTGRVVRNSLHLKGQTLRPTHVIDPLRSGQNCLCNAAAFSKSPAGRGRLPLTGVNQGSTVMPPFPLSLPTGFPMLPRQWLSGWFPMNWRGPTWRWR